nr:EAL domain-containing protein [Leptospira ellisii]
MESFLRIQPVNLESLVALASRLNLIQSDEFYVGIYENQKPILENRGLKYRPLDKEFKPVSKNSNWKDFPSYKPDYCMYFIRVPFPIGQYALRTGIRIHKGEEKIVYSLISPRRNYDRADLAREKLPYRIRLTFSVLTVSIFLLAIYFSLLFARKISRPIIELANATQQISLGDTDISLEIRETGEIGALIDSFNQMVQDLKSKNAELMQSQRIAAWKEVAQRMAHEIKNPLTPIQLSAERIRRKMQSENWEQFQEIVTNGTDTIIKQVRVLEHLVNEFSDFARMPAPKLINQNLERIGYIHPDIMKVDIKIMRESLNRRSFKNVLSAIADMSQKLGSDLLFEGIETEEELHLALSMGANLLQGFYFSRPQGEFQDKKQFNRTLRDTLEKFSGLRFMELLEEFQKGQSVIDALGEKLDSLRHNGKEDLPFVLHLMLGDLPPEILSVFACDIFGYQMTPTYFRSHPGEDWDSDLTEIGNNYAWRPFFIRHKAKVVQSGAKWTVTEPMYDMDLHKQVVVFTYTLRDNYILVIKMDWERV